MSTRSCAWCEQPIPSRSRRTDALIHFNRPRTTDRKRVIGSKPAAFARWVFELLGAQPGDELDDLFPGSGGIGRAWRNYSESDGEDVEARGRDGYPS